MSDPVVRRAGPADEDAVAALLHESAADMYNRFAGGRERALRVLRRAFREPGTNAGADVIWVAELDGRVAGVAAAFPVDEAVDRGGAFLRLTLRSIPPWRWPGTLWLYWAGGRAAPSPPGESLYIDALATIPELRRRGAASALLDAIEQLARKRGLPAVALDTSLDNKPARALYARAGFEEVAYRPPGRGLPGFVALVKPLS
ncbi:MAG TPA: GNAT family N-acetyltransferase [Thermoleophilaceae bacterium]|jgi:ribosomal protein S18 acetylase RimI-like enzyme